MSEVSRLTLRPDLIMLQTVHTGRHAVLCVGSGFSRERMLRRWFRSNTRFGSRLALFALAIQIILSFGHVHYDGLPPASAKAMPLAIVDAAALSTSGPNHKSNGSVDFDCPICALIQMISTSAPSTPPGLPLLAVFSLFRLEASVELALAASPHFLFHARAPPSV